MGNRGGSRPLPDGKRNEVRFRVYEIKHGEKNVIVLLKEDSMPFDVPVKLTPFYE
jgi:hypothetical protein